MQGYIAKRILIAIFTIFAVMTVVFFVFRLGPADPVAVIVKGLLRTRFGELV